MRLTTLLFISALALGPGAALAGEGCMSDGASVVQHIFDEADTDGSGTLSPAEYEAAGLEGFGVSFAQTDADGSGETSLDEYVALYERHHPAKDEVSL